MGEEQIRPRAKGPPPTEIVEGLPENAPMPIAPQLTDQTPNIRLDEATEMQVFFAWEKLRPVYNVVMLICLMIKISISSRLFFVGGFDQWQWLYAFLLINVCFGIGPIVEGYLRWFSFPRIKSRWVAFVVGIAGGWLILDLLVSNDPFFSFWLLALWCGRD